MPHPPPPYDPNGVGQRNGNFLGLPLVDDQAVVFLAVPFDATVSYAAGTAGGPANVLAASAQLDVSLDGLHEPWALGYRWTELSGNWSHTLPSLRADAQAVIAALERGETPDETEREGQRRVDAAHEALAVQLERAVGAAIAAGRFPVVVGGEHAVTLGAYRALAGVGPFGILQVDAHMDLREAYEGFRYSHASIMYNALQLPQLERLVQVGIRDYAPAEAALASAEGSRVVTLYDRTLQERKLRGKAFAKTIGPFVARLPQRVWISFDIDGLDPALCAHTGTPVPGGLSFAEAQFLLRAVVESGREVMGMDIVEVAAAPHEYEGAVAARIAYDLAARAVLHARQGREVRSE